MQHKLEDLNMINRNNWDDPKLLGDSGEVPISEWSGWQFDSHHEIFSLLDGIKIS